MVGSSTLGSREAAKPSCERMFRGTVKRYGARAVDNRFAGLGFAGSVGVVRRGCGGLAESPCSNGGPKIWRLVRQRPIWVSGVWLEVGLGCRWSRRQDPGICGSLPGAPKTDGV